MGGYVWSQSDPAEMFEAITPSDSTSFSLSAVAAKKTRGIYVGGAGTVVAVLEGGTAVTFAGCAAGTVLPIKPVRINATGTTATGLVRLS